MGPVIAFAVLILVASCTTATRQLQESQPAGCSENHVLLIRYMYSVDGLQGSDLEQWTKANPDSNLTQLERQGITYTNATVNGITDSFPGMLALATGGNIAAHDVYYDDTYNRALWPPGTPCVGGKPNGKPGTNVAFTEGLDKDKELLNGGGDFGVMSIDEAKLPLDASCKPVYPHQHPQVNNIFEVIHSKGGVTAWADKHPAYDILNGPSGTGVTDLYTPEIESNKTDSKKSWTSNAKWTQEYDKLHVDAALNWIKGFDHSGLKSHPVPRLYGYNFQAVSVAQKLPGPNKSGGYNPNGSFQHSLKSALTSVGRLVNALKQQGLLNCTSIIITAKHGQSPIQHSKLKKINPDYIKGNLTAAGVEVAQVTSDTAAIIWLNDPSQTQKAVNALQAKADSLGSQELLYGDRLVQEGLVKAPGDPRAPQIIIKAQPGVLYTTSSAKVAVHGGLNEDDKHVALLVSGAAVSTNCRDKSVSESVYTRQVAPTVLEILSIDSSRLEAVKSQGTRVLPGLLSADGC